MSAPANPNAIGGVKTVTAARSNSSANLGARVRKTGTRRSSRACTSLASWCQSQRSSNANRLRGWLGGGIKPSSVTRWRMFTLGRKTLDTLDTGELMPQSRAAVVRSLITRPKSSRCGHSAAQLSQEAHNHGVRDFNTLSVSPTWRSCKRRGGDTSNQYATGHSEAHSRHW